MDSEAIFERADVTRRPGELLPGESEGPEWVATDPETGCKGVGDFENAALTNLVYAVDAYEDAEASAPFVSAGKEQTCEMRWLRTDETTLTARIKALLPF